MSKSINPIIYVVSTRRVVRRIDNLCFESWKSLEYMLTGMNYGTFFAEKNYAIVALLKGSELITRNLHEKQKDVLFYNNQFQTDRELITNKK